VSTDDSDDTGDKFLQLDNQIDPTAVKGLRLVTALKKDRSDRRVLIELAERLCKVDR
jgi:hypothetical protein